MKQEVIDAMGEDGVLIPRQSFNDDDWYVWEADTLEYVQNLGKNNFSEPDVGPTRCCGRGMTAKRVGIWRVPQ